MNNKNKGNNPILLFNKDIILEDNSNLIEKLRKEKEFILNNYLKNNKSTKTKSKIKRLVF